MSDDNDGWDSPNLEMGEDVAALDKRIKEIYLDEHMYSFAEMAKILDISKSRLERRIAWMHRVGELEIYRESGAKRKGEQRQFIKLTKEDKKCLKKFSQ